MRPRHKVREAQELPLHNLTGPNHRPPKRPPFRPISQQTPYPAQGPPIRPMPQPVRARSHDAPRHAPRRGPPPDAPPHQPPAGALGEPNSRLPSSPQATPPLQMWPRPPRSPNRQDRTFGSTTQGPHRPRRPSRPQPKRPPAPKPPPPVSKPPTERDQQGPTRGMPPSHSHCPRRHGPQQPQSPAEIRRVRDAIRRVYNSIPPNPTFQLLKHALEQTLKTATTAIADSRLRHAKIQTAEARFGKQPTKLQCLDNKTQINAVPSSPPFKPKLKATWTTSAHRRMHRTPNWKRLLHRLARSQFQAVATAGAGLPQALLQRRPERPRSHGLLRRPTSQHLRVCLAGKRNKRHRPQCHHKSPANRHSWPRSQYAQHTSNATDRPQLRCDAIPRHACAHDATDSIRHHPMLCDTAV